MKRNEELVVITKTYDLILWSCNPTSRFPRNHRFVLGERIERNLYELLETLLQESHQIRTPVRVWSSVTEWVGTTCLTV
ncbi:MAG: four helix bundle protein [Planctomycetota bacterium]|nr:four helix bundle protein [Planctomycetota bacterium]